MSGAGQDWDPRSYQRFGGLRLRPALDLLAQVEDLPDGPLVDLGCGTGVMGRALAGRFSAPVLGVDTSASMLAEARETGAYADLAQADIAVWHPEVSPALIYSNAALNWVPDHAVLLPRLVSMLAKGGTLAVQMPQQQEAPSHALLRATSAEMFPDRFEWSGWSPHVLSAPEYQEILGSLGALNLWETEYYQRLEPISEGHPVRAFTRSTAARPILDRLSQAETAAFFARYDAALEQAYPTASDGSVASPFRRLFMVLTRG